MVGCHALEKYATNFCGSVVSIVLSNHPYIQVLAVFLNHIEKLLDKSIIEIIVGDLSYDQIKNLVLRRDTRYVYSQFLNGIYFLDQRRS